MPSLVTFTLGCKVNQYETEYVRQGLALLGYRDATEGEQADLCLVNTCTVTADGDAKSRKAVRHLHRLHPGAEIVVMGCYATRAAEEVAALPGVGDVITDKRQLPALLARLGLVDIPTGISAFGPRHRAYVKVQDGCRMSCSYCIIPYVRPNLESRSVGEVVDEVRRLVGNGHREIVLTGIHLGHYGAESPSPRTGLADLLRAVVALDGEFRVRLSSLEATEATDALLDVMRAAGQRVCPHLHIALQSGSNAVLQRMQRRWPVERILERCVAARQALDEPALTTDVIVGFPGESDEDFAATCEVVSQARFAKLHIFRFSPRTGTPAAELPDRVPSAVCQRRAAELDALGEQLRIASWQRLAGWQLEVLVETTDTGRPGHVVGTSERYVPVSFAASASHIGQLVSVRATTASADALLGEYCSQSSR
jgi:threonylcarbamoyladenosine tRNA methylthiotransferase MtaB